LLALRESPEARRARDPSRRAVLARYGWPGVGEQLEALLRVSQLRREHT
jgi:hypothetical protein